LFVKFTVNGTAHPIGELFVNCASTPAIKAAPTPTAYQAFVVAMT
jgi:hypothetical protein